MNKSLLLIIADFLLLSLLALARFEETPEVLEEAVQEEATTNQDLIEVLEMSLEQERLSREEMSKKLDETKSELDKTIEDREAELKRLAEMEKKAKALQEMNKDLELAAADKEKIKQEYDEARKRLDQVQEERISLTKDLSSAKQKQAASKEKLKLIQEKLKERESQFKNVAGRLEKLSSDYRVKELEAQKLETQLQVAKTEKTMLTQNLNVAKTEIQTLEQEKVKAEKHARKLAQGVSSLAANSELIHEEIQKLQPMTMNKIFDLYKANRVEIEFNSTNNNRLGNSEKKHKAYAVVVGNKDKAFALVHEEFTPFTDDNLLSVDGRIRFNDKALSLTEVFSLGGDHRIVAAPLNMEWVKESGIKVFNLAKDPLRFPKSVVISQDNKFGEVILKQHPKFANFFKRESRIFTSLPGEVNADEGDVVFTKTGHLMGVMVNDEYAVTIGRLDTKDRIALGKGFQKSALTSALAVDEKARRVLPKELR